MQTLFHIGTVFAAGGVITNATPFSVILLRILDFLLSIIGVLGIIGLVVSGILYLTAAGDEDRIRLAKRSALASVIGIVIALGALVLTSQLTVFFS
ncbi:MAG: hypothetical protein WAW00_00855 [Candidatus Moraniibacteriota bacterium]